MSLELQSKEELLNAYKVAISHFTTGVAVITTRNESGPAGMTASAVASLSLDPLQLLVCIKSDLPTRHAIEEAGTFAVNVLGDDQAYLALHFARAQADKFAGVDLRSEYEVPVLSSAIAHFVCNVSAALPGGDHTIIIGDVIDCTHAPGANPLVYFSRQFSGVCSPSVHSQLAYEEQLSLMM